MEPVKLVNLTTGYKNKEASIPITDGIDAILYSSELTCLLGPNGAGKSTLLKTLSAFIPPLEGEIFIKGKVLGDYSPRELAKQMGVVLTERPIIDDITVQELVAMGRSPYTNLWDRLSDNDHLLISRALELVGIESFRDRRVDTLSDGERQKVMIAKVLAQETPIIFLDEPTAFLDYPGKVEIMQLLKSLARANHLTVFLSTHDLEIALQIADKVWLLDKENGLTIGSPQDLGDTGMIATYFNRPGLEYDSVNRMFRIIDR